MKNFFIFFIISCVCAFFVLVGISRQSPSSDISEATVETRVCNVEQAKNYLGSNALIRTIHDSKIVVEPMWFDLPYDKKEGLNNVILCYLKDGYASRTQYVHYFDPYTNKEVASYGAWGFSVEDS